MKATVVQHPANKCLTCFKIGFSLYFVKVSSSPRLQAVILVVQVKSKSTDHQVMKIRNKLTFNSEIYNIYFMLPTGIEKSVVVKLLRAEYERRSKLMPLSWFNTIQLPLENVYTRLKIVSRRKADFQVENVEVDMYDIFKAPGKGVLMPVEGSPSIFSAFENPYTELKNFQPRKFGIQVKNDEVDMYEIFKDLKKGEDVMTLVEGSPGIGKTTFCLKLAYDWARETVPTNSSFPKLEFVLLLKCRDIDKDIMEAIKEQLLPEDMKEETWAKFSEFIKDIHNQEKILIILDGLDELPEKSQHFVDKLLRRRILPFCYILVTSRQEKGIDVRKNFEFDLLLEIKGFTEDDAYCYIKKHFQNVGPKHSSKGETLAKEVKENTLLNALRNNPLNLLLLCVIYEDYDGKLPTSRTELYQVIVRCLLRRYCAKHSLVVPEDNTLEKRFDEDILALGELAWTCLLNDRQSFREEELAEREVRNKNLVARKIGLLYKEERLKRILRSQYEYWFLHKTFQEYLAAAFITQKLLSEEVNVFEFTTFDDLVQKYPQVFLFVSGMLGEKATELFNQIGEELKKRGDWDWNQCSEQESRFFLESFSETGHAEQMATSLCRVMPFPEEVFLGDDGDTGFPFAEVLIACGSFLNLQTPVQLEACFDMDESECDVQIRCIESLSKLTSVSLKTSYPPLNSREADRIRKWLSVSKSLLEFTFKLRQGDVNSDVPVLLCNGLASCKTLRKIKFSVSGAITEACINAIETGLSPDTPLTSAVILEIYGPISFSAIHALHKLLTNKSLISLSLQICGDVTDVLAGAVSEALARQTVLKFIDLCLGGKLSSAGASSLRQGLLKNSSLNHIKVVGYGERPDNWQSVVETLYSTEKSPVSCAFHPNTLDNIGHDDVGLVLAEKALVPKQDLTVNVWGKLSCEGADALCEILIRSSPAFKLLTLNVHGNVTEDVANSVARCLKRCNILFLLSINIWGSLTPEGETILSELSKSNLCVHLASEESNQVLDISIENPAASRAFFTKVKDTRKEKISLTVSNISGEIREWTHHLADALAENRSLTSINLTVNSCLTDGLGECLLQSASIKCLSLAINSSIKRGLLCKLGACFAKMAFLTSLSLEINDYSDEKDCSIRNELKNVLLSIKSLSTLSVAVHDDNVLSFWNGVLDDYLQECTSLTKLSYSGDTPSFGDGLAVTTSLKTLNITLNVDFPTWGDYNKDRLKSLIEGLSLNGSLTTLTVTVSLTLMDALEVDSLGDMTLKEGLSENRSITTFNLTINEFGEGISDIDKTFIALQVFEGLAQNTTITTFNLTLNSSREVSDDWLPWLCNAVNKNSSLTTLKLKVNNRCATCESRLYDFRKLLSESRSLSILELEVSFYGKENEAQRFYSEAECN